MSDNIFSDALRQVLAECCTPAMVRRIESGESATVLWKAIEESGFANALMTEEQGGAGLSLSDAFELMALAGEYALPLPFALTMLLRPWLAQSGVDAPGAVTLALNARRAASGALYCQAVPYGLVTDHVVVVMEGRAHVLDATSAQRVPTGVHASLESDMTWSQVLGAGVQPPENPICVGALSCAVQMAGAMRSVLERTVGYANERKQFGKAIGKFQAIQHQLSVLAGDVYAAHMAAELGCATGGMTPNPLLAAIAKARCSEAAASVAAIAHAVHGAIGITEEFDLQLHTRRLHEWRTAYGSESYWQHEIGSALLASSSDVLAFLRENAFAGDPAATVP